MTQQQIHGSKPPKLRGQKTGDQTSQANGFKPTGIWSFEPIKLQIKKRIEAAQATYMIQQINRDGAQGEKMFVWVCIVYDIYIYVIDIEYRHRN